MPEHATVDSLTPAQRHAEVAAILAIGLLRYLRRVRLLPSPEPPESEQNSLDVCGETHGRHGSAGERRGDPETGNGRFCPEVLGVEPATLMAAFGQQDASADVREAFPSAKAAEAEASRWAEQWMRSWSRQLAVDASCGPNGSAP